MFNNVESGTVEGTGSAINVKVGFQPRRIEVVNIDTENPIKAVMRWLTGMVAASALKKVGNVCLSAPGLAIGTTDAAEVRVVNTTAYLSKGVFKSKSAAEVAFTATTHDMADLSTCKYLISINAAGTLSITKGNEVLTADGGSLIPATPAGDTALGYIQIVTSGAVFNATTDLLSAGHITDTYVDLSSVGGEEKVTANGITVYSGEAPPVTLTGTCAVADGSAVVTGTSTLFTTELSEGDMIDIGGIQRIVLAIASATSLTVTEDYSAAQSGATGMNLSGSGEGFTIGADTDLNVSGETMSYTAYR